MIITLSGRHLEITPAIRAYAEEKANKLTKFYDLIKEIEVILDGKDARNKSAEIIVSAEHRNMFVGHADGEDLYACIDKATDKLARQLHDHKEQHRNRKHPGA